MNRFTLERILFALVILGIIVNGLTMLNIIEEDAIINAIKAQFETGTPITSSRLSYGRVLNYLDKGWVSQVDFYENGRIAIVQTSSPELGYRPQAIRVDLPLGASQFIEKLKDYDINFDAHPVPRKSIFLTIASNLVLPLLFIAGLIFFFQNSDNFSQNPNSLLMNLGKSPARSTKRTVKGVSFDDIAGIDEAKADFEEIVSFLNEPDRYTLVGARIPKGVLLVGPPGTGKTLLAKAIATQARVPFYNIAGSEFVELFIGVGAARVRDLFRQAAENSPCIIFIDEIDAVGRQRGAGVGGGNDEREQTLNQLLTEMDGFSENKSVIVVGATNRIDILDAALLRPGRFDRQITIGLPNTLGRLKILNVHAKQKPFEENLSLAQLAVRTAGFSGADLANLLNEAAILATREKKITITKKELNEAADRIIGGLAGPAMENNKNKRLIAYHEVGHAIVASLLKYHDDVAKITLIPRGGAKGLTWFLPEDDQQFISRMELVERIMTTLGGRAVEQIVFGETEVTTGASNDLKQATNIARAMATRYGMSKLGLRYYDEDQITPFQANEIAKEVADIMNECEQKTKDIILDNRVIIDIAVDKLLEKETLTGDEFRQILSEYTNLPVKEKMHINLDELDEYSDNLG